MILMPVSFTIRAQGVLATVQNPKYLPENKAASLVNFTVNQKNDGAIINISSVKNVKNYSFYILKGISYDNGVTTWQIIDSFQNTNQSMIDKTINDKVLNREPVMYRIMVLDKDERIEYTPIICMRNYNA